MTIFYIFYNKYLIMKTLYESILDDEDVLVNKAIDYSKNPFVAIYNLFKNENDWKVASNKYHSKVDKIIKSSLSDWLPKVVIDNLKIRYYDQSLGITTNTYSPIDLITIRENIWHDFILINTNPDDKISVSFLNPRSWNTAMRTYGFKTKKEYWEWIEKVCKNFNLNPSKKDIYYYSI